MAGNHFSSASQTAATAASFFVPISGPKIAPSTLKNKKITAIIPTYKPDQVTVKLIQDLLSLKENLQVIVIDDSTPTDEKASMRILKKMVDIAKTNKRLILLQTSFNHLKAAALNVGLFYIESQKVKPHVVITFDDDVVIAKNTITEMVKALYTDPKLGVVCTKAYVKNKNTNLLTRLQNFEYQGFNMTKISDNGFLFGPLVMQGMLSAFRYAALSKVKGFDTDGLIEDYEMTVKIKKAGWNSAIARKAIAWTYVPEKWGDLWRQRVRWTYGGLHVMKNNWKSFSTIYQDLVGHVIFLSLLTLVALSFVFQKTFDTPILLVSALFVMALIQFVLSYTITVLMLTGYPEKDKADYILKLSILPEFVYSNVLSVILLGSYLFFLFNSLSKRIDKFFSVNVQKNGSLIFNKLGYTAAWGTRA
jgi:cellulose synthase/poly-beta-1,6-N-acetylglucosamine synthase-like glycosyltransferase